MGYNNREYKEKNRDGLTAFCLATLEVDKYVFERCVVDQINSLSKDTDIAVVTDMRTTWNLKYFTAHLSNCVKVRINVLDVHRTERGWVKSDYDTNFVEVDLDSYDGWDYVINNNANFHDLMNGVKTMLKDIA